METEKRSGFSSSFGFLMASVGAAVGLGNIWGFPYRLGKGGGFIFIALYLLFVITVGIPLMLAELKIGKSSRCSCLGAYRRFGSCFGTVGIIGIIACFIVLCYYFFFGGLIMREIARLAGVKIESELFWHLSFAFITLLIVLGGISDGIEKCSRVMVPLLIASLGILAVITLQMPGAHDALDFLFRPDATKFNAETVKSALGQALFSLSLGQGIMVTYASYADARTPLMRQAVLIPLLDTAAAILAALAIMPAAFSTGVSPETGPALLFSVMPRIFGSLKYGPFFSLLFFVPVFFAAMTSAVSMLETPVAALCEETRLKRAPASLIITAAAAVGGIPLCIDIRYYELYESLSEKVFIMICAFMTCLLISWKRKNSPSGLAPEGRSERLFMFMLKYVTPAILVASALF